MTNQIYENLTLISSARGRLASAFIGGRFCDSWPNNTSIGFYFAAKHQSFKHRRDKMVVFLRFDEAHDLKNSVNILGIINSPVISFTYQGKKTLARFGVILPCRTQIIIEVWSQTVLTTPKFAKNWRCLQLISIFKLFYGGDTVLDGKVYKIFRLSCKNENKFGRFIWLSHDSENFWYNPILDFDNHVHHQGLARDSWPRRVPFGTGILNKSKGSVITKIWTRLYPYLHTREFEGFSFEDLFELRNYVKKGVFGYLNLITKKKMHQSANFERLKSFLFHISINFVFF